MADQHGRRGGSPGPRHRQDGGAGHRAAPSHHEGRRVDDRAHREQPRSRDAAGPPLSLRGELIYGRNGVAEALRGRRRLYRLLLADGIRPDERIERLRRDASRIGLTVETVPRAALDATTAGANHQGVGLDAEPYPYADLDDILGNDGAVLMLDHLQDPQNIGTLLRAAEASGAAGVVLPADRSASITPAVVNASAGAVELLAIAQVPNLVRAIERAKERGRWVVGLEDDERAVDLFDGDLPIPAVLIVGAEGPGIGPHLRRHCDVLAKIPMMGRVTSLNASTAGAIALFELWRRQRSGR